MTDSKYEKLIEYPLRDIVEVPSSYGAVKSDSSTSGEHKEIKQTILISALQEFRHIPIECRCSNCQQRIVTRLEKKNGALTWLACAGAIFLGCWAGCCLIPFCVKSFKNTIHYCPNCGKMLAEAKRI
ncbi:unnamed protein product [Adineta steineri]|uniref:LITAF domain-containing protein n=2 Tax=Adineta steineri TaxID=433720 RepID=A0A814ZCI0_9BILA|nr:unnamed protein product [Adineta steineri]CAF0773328.1 unnamed protein product [Adineta steineri]CAF1239903.1 unnamed protein product [Adineta steineri]CAF3672610.1 unnamed protein product [Adineta steineri]CAF4247784.1 unnamed protein product [Adineta steineri]